MRRSVVARTLALFGLIVIPHVLFGQTGGGSLRGYVNDAQAPADTIIYQAPE